MDFAVNYIFKECENFIPYKNTYIKYPGTSHDIETLVDLISSRSKILLHGIIPSSGSIMDPALCDNLEDFARYFKLTSQRWLSLHFDYKPRYNNRNYDKTIEDNIIKIRKYIGKDIPILIENVPLYDTVEEWCFDPANISNCCQKYGFEFLLDIPHAIVAAQHRGESIEEYLTKLPLDLVREIHVAGCEQSMSGVYRDAHTECNTIVYKLLEQVLYSTPNCQMITIEYTPFIRTTPASNQVKIADYQWYSVKQKIQLNRVRNIVKIVQQT